MDQRSVINESFSWYKNRGFWKWMGGFTVLFLLMYVVLVASAMADPIALMQKGMPSSYAMQYAYASPALALFVILVLLLASFLVYIKIITMALKQSNLPANPVTLSSVVKYFLLGLLIFLIMLVLIGVMVLALAFIVGILGGLGMHGTLSLAIVLLLAMLMVLVAFYVGARFVLASPYFWSKKGCGIVEAINLSLSATHSNVVKIIVSQIFLAVALFVAFLSIFIISAIAAFILILLGVVLGALFAPLALIPAALLLLFYIALQIVECALQFGASAYWQVAVYKRLSLPANAQKATKAKAAGKKKKAAGKR